MIDTHTHIYLEEFDIDRNAVMQRAIDAGVKRMILPNVDMETFSPMQRLHADYPDTTFPAMGLHPTSVNADYKEVLDKTVCEIKRGGYVAVGEVGLDYYWDTTFKEEQKIVLIEMLRVAKSTNLPAIIHCREAIDDIIDIFKQMGDELPLIDMHSFTGSVEDVKRLRQCGDIYFGINGIVTFKNARLDDTVREIGIDRLMLETDSPYLAPSPHRGRRNESSYIPLIAAKIAEILGISNREAAEATTRNACRLFKLPELA